MRLNGMRVTRKLAFSVWEGFHMKLTFASATIGLLLVVALFLSFYLKLWYDVLRFSFSIPMGVGPLWSRTIYSPLFWGLAVLLFVAGIYFASRIRA